MSLPRPRLPIDVGGMLYFRAYTRTHGYELWKTDGSSKGVVLVKDIYPGTAPGVFRFFPAVIGNVLYFRADDGTSGPELWRSDGTTQGTRMVKDIMPPASFGAYPDHVSQLTVLGKVLYFVANDRKTGYEIWRSDGTSSGTRLLKNIRPDINIPGPAFTELTAVGRALYFVTDNLKAGSELWTSDGTTLGTKMVADLRPGRDGSHPSHLTLSRGRLLFFADDGLKGRELWALDVGATSQEVGQGCAVAAPPGLHANEPVLGGPLTIRVDGAAGGSNGLLLLGTGFSQPAYLGQGCSLYLDTRKPYLPLGFQANAQGQWSLSTTVPNVPVLQGFLIPLQAGVGPTPNPPLGIDISGGLYLVPGR